MKRTPIMVKAMPHPARPVMPTAAQKEAGNYAMERMTFQGLPITIENPRGSIRSGRDRGGHEWSVSMAHHYGYIRGTRGSDGDHYDVYVGPNADAERAFIVTTMAPPTFATEDEQKAMLGFNSEEEAKAAYLAHYDNPGFFGGIRAMPMAEFKENVMATTSGGPTMLKGAVLFLKAQIKGGASGDLFATPVVVAPHLRDGKMVAGYTAVRHKAPDTPSLPPVMTLEQFAKQNRKVTTADVDGHLHAGLRSKPQTKTYQRWFDRKLADLQAARDATSVSYQAAVERGEIRHPESLSRREKLEASAAGHPDNEATQAARRLLAKMDARETTRARPAIADRMGFAWEAEELPGMTAEDARSILREEAEARAAGVFGNENTATLQHARRLLGLPDNARIVTGDRPLTTGKWRVESAGERRTGLSNWQSTPEEALAEARQWESNRQAVEQQKAEQAEREAAITGKLRAGAELTDADLTSLGLKARAGFAYISPVVQRLFGISRAKVRAAMGNTIKRQVNGMNTAYVETVDARRALANAAAWAAENPPRTVLLRRL